MSDTIYICTNCDAQFPKWSGRCLECGAWGSLEQTKKPTNKVKETIKAQPGKVIELNEVKDLEIKRLKTNIAGFDRVMGGGIVPGGVALLGGDPGVGKSTLALQLIDSLTANYVCLYISAEESAEQVVSRLKRLNCKQQADKLKFLPEDKVETITATLEQEKPTVAIIDSIQTIYTEEIPSEAGSINQVRACTVKLLEIAKRLKIAIIIIGHVTKEGTLAGPKTMEHLVDVVLYLEGDKYRQFRLLRSIKNRFAHSGEVAVWEMTKTGLKEVANPSQVFLAGFANRAGSVITAVAEGSQVFLIEIQALISKTSFGYPKRSVSGFEQKRLELLCTILTKRADINLNNFDVYLNIVGGLTLKEPALDLAVIVAIISAWQDKVLPEKTVIFGEVGLSGEVRVVSKTKERVKEALKLGFKQIILPDFTGAIKNLELIKIKEISQLLSLFK
ncbi:DNA repair protein RadA [Patescibacteria group bacterium]|nr:DNA repair protein RadA [Patescibacteria group bacterium]